MGEHKLRDRFDELLDLVSEEIASETEWKELQVLLAGNDLAIESYVDRLGLCANLYIVAEEGDLYKQYLEREDIAASDSLAGVSSKESPRTHARGRRWGIDRELLLIVIAASLVGAMALLPIVNPGSGNVNTQAKLLGQWTNGADAEWAQGSLVFVGDQLTLGSYQLRTGVAELTLNSGAVLTFEGPASFEFLSPDHCEIDFGQVVTRSPSNSTAFELTTAHAAFLHRNAEAGVRVTRTGHAEVVVYDGEVDLSTGTKDSSNRIVLQKGNSLSIKPDGDTRRATSAEIAPSDFFRRLGPVVEIDPADNTTVLADDFNDGVLSLAENESGTTEKFQLEEQGGELHGIIPPGESDPTIDVKLPSKEILGANYPYCRYRLQMKSTDDVRIAELFYYNNPANRPTQPGDRRSISIKQYPDGPVLSSAEFRGPLPVVEALPIRYLRLDPIHRTSTIECLFAYDYVFFDRYETLGIAEFDCAGDLQSCWGRRTSELNVASGLLCGSVSEADPQVFTGSAYFSADQFSHFEVRLRRVPSQAQSLRRIELFWEKPGDAFSQEKKASVDLKEDFEFHTYRIDLRRANGWNGNIKRLRLDFDAEAAGDGSMFEIDYLRVLKMETSEISI